MKLILAILFAAFAALAQVPQETVNNWMLMAVPRGGCSTYQTTNAWDEFIEGFQTPTTGYESNIWTKVGTTANVYEAADSSSLTTYKPNGACSQALKIVLPNDGTETLLRGDLGKTNDLDTIQTDVYFCMYIEAITLSGVNDFSIFIARLTATGGGSTLWIAGDGSGGYVLKVVAATTSSTIAVTTGQWYTIRMSYDTAQAANGSSLTVWSNGSQIGSVTFQRTAGVDIRYLSLGCNSGLAAGENATLWYDLVSIKTN